MDTLRYPLDDKVLYHDCGEFFNLNSIKLLYQCPHDRIDDSLLEFLAKEPCLRCKALFGRLRICFPRCAIEDESEFATLTAACGYFALDH